MLTLENPSSSEGRQSRNISRPLSEDFEVIQGIPIVTETAQVN